MKRLICLVLLLPLAGCELFEDFTALAEPEPASPCTAQPAIRACAGPDVVQAGFPAQTAEPPR